MVTLAIFNPAEIINSFFDAAPIAIYLMVFGLMVVESSFIPFPSEVIVLKTSVLTIKTIITYFAPICQETYCKKV